MNLKARFLARRNIGAQRFRDSFGQLALQSEKIRQFAIKSVRPNMRVRARIDELRIYAHAIPRLSHCSFKDVSNAQRFANLTQVARAGPVLPHRGSADHLQIRYLRETRQNIIVHPLGEVGIFLVVA